MTMFFTIGEVAAKLGVPRWRLAYWIEKETVPQPTATVPGRRLFTPDDVDRIRKQLANRNKLNSGGQRNER